MYNFFIAAFVCISSFWGVVAWPAAVFERAQALTVNGTYQTFDASDLVFNATEADIYANIEKAWSSLKLNPRQNGFNAQVQYVSTTGQYAFRPPNFAAGDQRGNCPALNALANHGYIPRNGIATAAQMQAANQQVFSQGPALTSVLSLFGVVMHGNLVRHSIGGPTPQVPGLLGLLGTPQGTSGNLAHNKYETDASGTRGDLYLYGNSADLVLSQFQQLFDTQPNPATADYTLQTVIPFRANRFIHSIQNNPYFFSAPLSGVIFGAAGYNFMVRLMRNHSAEYPQGRLNQEVLKSFFAISGPRSNFVYTRGHERIPDNWYRRPTYYDFPEASADIIASALSFPAFVSVGGNQGRVNTFTGINLGQLTGGVFNAATLLQGNNLLCFTLQLVRFATPDLLVGPGGLLSALLSPVLEAVGDLTGLVGGVLSPYGCPALRNYEKSLFNIFPGRSGI